MASNGQSTVATENTQKDDKRRNVWYCLVTSDGKAFQASSTTSTELSPSTTIIAKFRKVIMTENAFMLRHHVSSIEGVATDQKANQLYLPITSDFPEIDAWIPNVGGFQLIVGKTYSIHESASTVLAKLHRKGENRLYLVVPPSHYDEFTKQEPLSVRQFVLLIPHPKTPTMRNKMG